mgnify:CR=1 FL=1
MTESILPPIPPGREGLPAVGETLAFLKNGFAFIEERNREFGPVFRSSILGRKSAIISGPDACAVWIDKEKICREDAQPAPIFKIFAGPSLPHLDNQAHADRKMLVLSAFTREVLASYVPGLSDVIASSLDQWRGGEFDAMPAFKRLAIEGICRNFLGLRGGSQLNAIVADYTAVTRGIGALPIAAPGTAFGKALAARDRLLAFFMETIRRRGFNSTGDGLSRIMQARLPNGTVITPEAMMRELHHIIIAGYIIFAEFAASVIELNRKPEMRRRIEQEIAAHAGADPTIESLERMTYLMQFVMEVKRLTPILPAIFGKAKKTFEFAGRTIPEGWMVLWALRATLVEQSVYDNPLEFDPERFSPERAEHKRHPHAFVPHGPGSPSGHLCPGMDYATIFMKLFIVHLLKSGMTWSLAEPNPEYNWSLTPPEPRGGLKIRV